MNHATLRAAWDGVAYQAGWFAAIWGAATGLGWLGLAVAVPVVALHLATDPGPAREARVILAVTAVGFALDSSLALLGVLTFHDAWPGTGSALICPPWLVGVWAMFAATLGTTLRGLDARPWLSAALGAVAGPLAYGAGSRIGAAELGEPVWGSLLTLSMLWAAFTPLLFRLRALIGAAP